MKKMRKYPFSNLLLPTVRYILDHNTFRIMQQEFLHRERRMAAIRISPVLPCVLNRDEYSPLLKQSKNYVTKMTYSTSDGAEYTLAASSLFSIYKLRASSPNSSILVIKSIEFFSSSPCSLINQSKNWVVRKSFTS